MWGVATRRNCLSLLKKRSMMLRLPRFSKLPRAAHAPADIGDP